MSAVETVCKAHFVPGSKDSCKVCPLYYICWHFQGLPEDRMEIMEEKAKKWLSDKEKCEVSDEK